MAWQRHVGDLRQQDTGEYRFQDLSEYVRKFKAALQFAGKEFKPSERRVIQQFITGLGDPIFVNAMESKGVDSLEDAYVEAEQTREELSRGVQSARMFNKQWSARGDQTKPTKDRQGSTTATNAAAMRPTFSDGTATSPTAEKKWCSYHNSHSHTDAECSAQNRNQQANPRVHVPNYNGPQKGTNVSVKTIDINKIDVQPSKKVEIQCIPFDFPKKSLGFGQWEIDERALDKWNKDRLTEK